MMKQRDLTRLFEAGDDGGMMGQFVVRTALASALIGMTAFGQWHGKTFPILIGISLIEIVLINFQANQVKLSRVSSRPVVEATAPVWRRRD